jgi:predicted transcriptional regulator
MSAADTTVITTRIHKSLNAKLEALARCTKRSKSFLAAEAIAAYLELNEWQIGEITAGLKNSTRAELCPKNRPRSSIAGYCSEGDGSPPGICSRLLSPPRGHSRAHCGGQPECGGPHDRENPDGGAAFGGIPSPRPTRSRSRHTRTRHPRTRYIVPYRVKGDVVQIITVLHSAQRWPDILP